jgi:hypothetical protein
MYYWNFLNSNKLGSNVFFVIFDWAEIYDTINLNSIFGISNSGQVTKCQTVLGTPPAFWVKQN